MNIFILKCLFSKRSGMLAMLFKVVEEMLGYVHLVERRQKTTFLVHIINLFIAKTTLPSERSPHFETPSRYVFSNHNFVCMYVSIYPLSTSPFHSIVPVCTFETNVDQHGDRIDPILSLLRTGLEQCSQSRMVYIYHACSLSAATSFAHQLFLLRSVQPILVMITSARTA